MAADRTSKRGDNWEPVTGVVSDMDGPADIRGATLRFLAKIEISTGPPPVFSFIDSNNPLDGECINVEDETGDPEDRGKWRFEQTGAATTKSVGEWVCELEVVMPNGKIITFPSKESDNPTWQIDADIVPV
jgi:hypothetical protein